MIPDDFNPAPGSFAAWLADAFSGRTKRTARWTVDRAKALAGMAFSAGWRRGWCAAKGLPYPPPADFKVPPP